MSASYTCPKCGLASHNPKDVRERYCGNCHQFADQIPRICPVTAWDCLTCEWNELCRLTKDPA